MILGLHEQFVDRRRGDIDAFRLFQRLRQAAGQFPGLLRQDRDAGTAFRQLIGRLQRRRPVIQPALDRVELRQPSVKSEQRSFDDTIVRLCERAARSRGRPQ